VDRRAGVGEQEPAARDVVVEYLADVIGPPGVQRHAETWLERLHGRACLEVGDVIGERNAQHGRPGFLVHELDRTDRLGVVADPGLDLGHPPDFTWFHSVVNHRVDLRRIERKRPLPWRLLNLPFAGGEGLGARQEAAGDAREIDGGQGLDGVVHGWFLVFCEMGGLVNSGGHNKV
jgi:hypothetical protein